MLIALAPLGCASIPADLLEGGSWQYSIDGGETFSDAPPALTESDQVAELISRITFDVASTDGIAELHLHANALCYSRMTMALNGVPIRRPYEELGYLVVPGTSPDALKVGRNELTFVETFKKYGDEVEVLPPATARLVPMTAEDLAFQTGPVLGAFDASQFSVTCRTNMIAEVVCRARPTGGGEEMILISQSGLMHEFAVVRGEDIDAYEYRLEARLGEVTRTTDWLPAPRWADVTDGALRFAVASDVQTVSEVWPTLAAAIARDEPDFLVFPGDMVNNGRNDADWDAQFLGPARELFSAVPLYPVQGNHEVASPILNDLFYTAAPNGRGLTWAQQIGGVQLIAVDGGERYYVDTDNRAWLEKVLAESTAKFIFLFSHYPGWSSSFRVTLDEHGKPDDGVTHQAQTIFMDLLAEYGGTAFVAGHQHYYERSELPTGVTAIVCGGGGGHLDGRPDYWRSNNPHSQAFAAQHHYLRFDVDGETCTMTVIAMNGDVIDTRTWQARPQAPVRP